MTTRDKIRKPLSLTISALMITSLASIMLLTVPLAGATATGILPTDETVKSGTVVTYTVTSDTGTEVTIQLVVDRNDNGVYEAGVDNIVENTGTTDIILNLDTTGYAEGTYDVYAAEKEAPSEGGNLADWAEQTTTLTIDDTAPEVEITPPCVKPDTLISHTITVTDETGVGAFTVDVPKVGDVAVFVVSNATVTPSPDYGVSLTGIDVNGNPTHIEVTKTTVSTSVVLTFDAHTPVIEGTYAWSVHVADTVSPPNTETRTVTSNVDSTPPTMVSAETKTTTTIDVTFSEDLNIGTIHKENFSVTGNTVETAVAGLTDNIVTLTLGTAIATDATPDVTYTKGVLADIAGNLVETTTTLTPTDGVPPTMDSAETKTTTTIDVTFSEDLDVATVAKENFSVVGNAVTGAISAENVVTLTLENEIDTYETPDVTYTQGILADIAGNLVATTTDLTPTDGVPPTMDNATTTSTTTIDVTFSEDLENVAKENFSVTGNTVETAVAGLTDNIVTLTLGTAIATDATPDVTYTKGVLADIKGNLVADTTLTAPDVLDGVGPVLEYVIWTDVDGDTFISETDTLEFIFSERMDTATITAENVNADLLVTGKTYGTDPTVEWNIPENDTVTVTLESGETIAKEDTVDPAGTVTDAFGNPDATSPPKSIAVPPTADLAVTEDSDLNGYIDAILITFSEPVDEATAIAENFDVVGYAGEAIGVDDSPIDDTVRITFAENLLHGPDTDEKPNIDIAYGAIEDMEQTPIGEITEFATDDGAAPVLLHAVIDSDKSDADGTGTETYVIATFSEAVDTSSPGMDIDGAGVDDSGDQDGIDNTYTIAMNSVVQSATSEITSITVTDGAANSGVLYENDNVRIDAFRRTLTDGWNYVSFPIADRHEYDMGDYFSDNTKVGVVWSYADGAWACYDPDIDPADKVKVRGGFGYLVVIKSDQTLLLAPNVYNVATGEYPIGIPAQRSVDAGWNLIGHYQEFDQTKVQALETVSTGVNFVGHPVYTMTPTGLIATNILTPGQAYWAFADVDGTYAEGAATGT